MSIFQVCVILTVIQAAIFAWVLWVSEKDE